LTTKNTNWRETGKGHWYALASDGDIYNLSDCGDFDAAEESAKSLGIDVIWIADPDQAKRWEERLKPICKTYTCRRLSPTRADCGTFAPSAIKEKNES
jgi:hypothetical protein